MSTILRLWLCFQRLELNCVNSEVDAEEEELDHLGSGVALYCTVVAVGVLFLNLSASTHLCD